MKKILILGLIIWQMLFTSVYPLVILAQEVEIQTGDTVAVSSSDILTNVSDTSVSTSTDSGSLEVTTDQTAIIDSISEADSLSGDATVSGNLAVNISTGDSTAIANNINSNNISTVGSNTLIYSDTILGEQTGDINLSDLYQNVISQDNFLPKDTTVSVDQTANENLLTTTNSESGEINAEISSGNTQTGDSTTVSNTVNLTNLNLVRTSGIVFVINIIGNLLGDILIPNINEMQGALMPKELEIVTEQTADVNSSTLANSSSGNVTTTGGEILKTGDATSIANTNSFVNLVKIGDVWVWLLINNLGNWNGSLVNWENPGSSQVVDSGTSLLEKDKVVENNTVDGSLTVVTNQEATINSSTIANSKSGDIATTGNGNAKTGNTFSLANDFSLTNFVGIGGSFMFGILNILGNWTGNLVLASPKEEESINNNSLTVLPIVENDDKDTRTPDLNINISNNVNDFVYPGDTILAKITVVNQSPFLAREVKVNGSLSNDHPMPAIPMQWDLGNLAAGEKVEIEFSIGLIDELPAGIYHLSAEAIGKSESGDKNSSGWFTSNFVVKLKYFASQFSSEVSAKEEVLGVDSVSSSSNKNFLLDNQKYLPYLLIASILLLILISFLRRRIKKKKHLKNLI